jgi:hypothetical protein
VNIDKQLMTVDYLAAPKIEVLHSKRRRSNATLGMKIWRSASLNVDSTQIVEHIEIGCPGYVCTDRGPMMHKKDEDDE